MLRARQNRSGSLSLVLACFLASAFLRVGDPKSAIAREIQTFRSDHQGTEAGAEPAAGEPQCEKPGPLLQAVHERSAQLDAREKGLASRLQTLRVAKLRLDDQLAELERAERRLSEKIARADGAAEADVERLTAVYENMKPKNAARLFEAMDVEFAAGFLARMRPQAAAGVLALMKSETAYAVSAVIAGRNAAAPKN